MKYTIAILILFCFTTPFSYGEGEQKIYYQDSEKLTSILLLKQNQSVTFHFRNHVEDTNVTRSWINILSEPKNKENRLSIMLDLEEVASQRYQIIFPPLPDDLSDEAKKEIEDYTAKVRKKNEWKRAKFRLDYGLKTNESIISRGSYMNAVGDVIFNKVPEEEIGELVTSENGSIKVITIPLVKNIYDFQILIGDTEEIKELFKKNEWEIPDHQGNVTLYRE